MHRPSLKRLSLSPLSPTTTFFPNSPSPQLRPSFSNKIDLFQVHSFLHSFTHNLHQKLAALFSSSNKKKLKKELEFISIAFNEIPFFSSLFKEDSKLDSVMEVLCDAVDYEFVKKDDAVFHFGDKGDKLYIILKGKVDICIPKVEEEIFEEMKDAEKLPSNSLQESLELKRQIDRLRNKYRNKSSLNIFPHAPEKEDTNDHNMTIKIQNMLQLRQRIKATKRDADYNLVTEYASKYKTHHSLYFDEFLCLFKKVRTMDPGCHFGELALSTSLPRGASAFASTDLHIITLSKENYKRIFESMDQELKKKIRFFARLTGQSTDEAIIKFSYCFKERIYKYGQKIFEEGEIPSEVFVVKEGEVQITKKIFKKNQQKTSTLMVKEKKFSEKKLVKLEPYDLVGEGEALENKIYPVTATSSSNGTVLYVISIHDFKSLTKKYWNVFQTLIEKHKTKTAFWNTRVEEISCAESFASEGYNNLIKNKNRDLDVNPQMTPGYILKSNLSKAKAVNKELDKIIDSGIGKNSQNNHQIESLLESFGIKIPKSKDYFSKMEKERAHFKISHSTPFQSQKILKTEPTKLFKYPLEEMKPETFYFPTKVDMPLPLHFHLKSKSPSEPNIFGNKSFQTLRPHEVDALKRQIKPKDEYKLFDQRPKHQTHRISPIKKLQIITQVSSRDSSLDKNKMTSNETYPSFILRNQATSFFSPRPLENSIIKTK